MNEELNIEILEGIGGWGFSYDSLRRSLKDFKGSKIRVPLNSFGGDAFQALAIHNTLQGHRASVEINIVAYAASAGTMIASSGDHVTMADNGFYMIHNPAGGGYGEADDMDTTAKLLRDLTDSMVEMYYDRMERGCKAKGKAPCLTRDEIRQMMAETTWLPAAKALEYGFVDALTKGAKFTASAETGFFANVPKELTANHHQNPPLKMEEKNLQFVAGFLGLNAGASLADVQSAIFDQRNKLTALTAENANLKAENERFQAAAQAAQTAEAKELLDAALTDKRITNEQRPMWEENFRANHDNAKRLLGLMQGKVVKLSDVPNTQGNGGGSGTEKYQGKTFKELEKENPKALAALKENDPELFRSLFKAGYGVDWKE
jgi:ATP-dependent Clp protease protease subunit